MTYTIKTVPLADLHPDPDNSRIHNRRNIDTIKKSLEEFGQYRKMVVRKSDNLIVIGNGMYQAMKELGWTEAECRIADLTEEQTRMIKKTGQAFSLMIRGVLHEAMEDVILDKMGA